MVRDRDIHVPDGTPIEVAEAYARYVDRVAAQNKHGGHVVARDSHRGKVYDAEKKFMRKFGTGDDLTLDQAAKLIKRVFESRLWQKHKTRRASPRCPTVSERPRAGGSHAFYDHIELGSRGLNTFIVLHEVAHTMGHRNHHQGFRAAEVDLVRRFMGREAADYLKECFKEQKLKCNQPREREAKPFEKWIKTYERMANARGE